MSGKWASDTKIPEDENLDSGVLSGPISENLESGIISDSFDNPDSDFISGPCESPKLDEKQTSYEEDFGFVSGPLTSGDCDDKKDESESLSQRLSQVTVSAQTQQTPAIVLNQDIPPLNYLFEGDDDGDTQLHIAAVHGCEKSVSTLVRVCPDKTCLNFTNDIGHTALHLAVLGGHTVITRMLVLAGASLAVRDVLGQTPLHLAITTRHFDCLKALLAPVEIGKKRPVPEAVLNQKDFNGQACVHLAAAAGDLESLKVLLHFGADINARENLAGRTPLHVAAGRGEVRVTQYLVERRRERGVVVAARDYSGRTPRRLARRTPAASLFDNLPSDSDDDSDTDDEMYDDMDEVESLFEKMRGERNPINVA